MKFILPALTEATSPFWRPVKYSLFPPLGLATLAAYLDPQDDAVIEDEHVQPLRLDDAPDLVVIQVYITNAYRAYRLADQRYRAGSIAFLELLDTQRELLDARSARAASDQELGSRRIDLFKALGGGWQSAPAVAAKD